MNRYKTPALESGTILIVDLVPPSIFTFQVQVSILVSSECSKKYMPISEIIFLDLMPILKCILASASGVSSYGAACTA